MKYSQPIFIKTWQQQVNKQTNKNLLTTITVLDQEQTANIVHQCFHLEMPLPSPGTSLSKVDRGEVGKCPVVFIKMFIYACYRARYRTSQNTQWDHTGLHQCACHKWYLHVLECHMWPKRQHSALITTTWSCSNSLVKLAYFCPELSACQAW